MTSRLHLAACRDAGKTADIVGIKCHTTFGKAIEIWRKAGAAIAFQRFSVEGIKEYENSAHSNYPIFKSTQKHHDQRQNNDGHA